MITSTNGGVSHYVHECGPEIVISMVVTSFRVCMWLIAVMSMLARSGVMVVVYFTQ